MHLARALPLIGIAVVLYIIIVAISPGFLDRSLTFALPSKAEWKVSWRDALLLLGLVLFCVEVIKSSFSGAASMIDHILSLGLCVICLLLFLLVPACGTSTFFLLMILAAIDVVAGYVIAVRVARRDLQIGTA
ncbi:MAG: hypothetical protein F9K44_01825 [Hyphomicrobiaceae bacterium]|nr:MAG: hypothetical protein F9K44_01825 [Hyphomicrobiaceae bacterium]